MKIFRTALIVLATTYFGSPVVAQDLEPAQEVKLCLELIDEGNLEEARKISDNIVNWKYLFGYQLIVDAEKCLSEVTGKSWKYFTTSGSFLSGSDAEVERTYLEGAEDRRRQREEDAEARNLQIARDSCVRAKLVERLSLLEKSLSAINDLLESEAQNAIHAVCTELYKSDKRQALMNVNCGASFLRWGLPDTTLDAPLEELIQLYSETLAELRTVNLRLTLTSQTLLEDEISCD